MSVDHGWTIIRALTNCTPSVRYTNDARTSRWKWDPSNEPRGAPVDASMGKKRLYR